MITKKIIKLLPRREFVSVATCDLTGRPNAAPKFVVKAADNFIYLADFVIGRTYENLKINPKVSLSFMNIDDLRGYQINGPVEIMDSGKEYGEIMEEMEKRAISFTARRIVEEVRGERKHENFETSFPDRVVVYKIRIAEVIEIGPGGKLTSECN